MKTASPDTPPDVLLLVGNPNVGKSALFGHLTGKYVIVSNYPGTTVDVTRGRYQQGPDRFEVIDTPGVYSLQPQSEDEIVTRDILLENPDARVILVLDAKNLQRGLNLVQELCELEVRFCIALNMMDEALSLGLRFDIPALAAALGVPVVVTVATSGQGVNELLEVIPQATPGVFDCEFTPEIESSLRRLGFILSEAAQRSVQRFVTLSALVSPELLPIPIRDSLDPDGHEMLAELAFAAQRERQMPIRAIIFKCRANKSEALIERIIQRPSHSPGGISSWLGRQALHPVWGLAGAGLALFLVYEFVGVFGAGFLVNLLEGRIFEGIVNPAALAAVDRFIPWAPLRDLLVGEYGVITMALTYSFAIILPVVATFFIAFGILEDSGYMPRLAVMVNNHFRRIGLHGKAVLPMILGLGCDTMATLTARIMETRKERILVTLLLALGVPCSAQLGVMLGMMGAISIWGVVIWGVVVLGVLLATGAIAARILPGARSDFILELPPMRMPGLKNILVKTGARIEWYLREAVPLFVLGTLVLFTLDRLALLDLIREFASPLVGQFLGLPQETTDAFLVGFVRRDYGAAGLFEIQRSGLMTGAQTVVSLVIITLYVPCIANFFVMIKERGLRTALIMVGVVIIIATLVGGGLNGLLNLLHVNL
ncbi:MAG: ferrous iron transport protein B [bacterium]